MKAILPVGAVGLGLFLLLLSGFWSLLFPAASTWTDEKAQRMSALTGEVHTLLFQSVAARKQQGKYKGQDPTKIQAKYDQSQAELEALREEFEGIRDRPQTITTYLRWSGTVLVLLGGAAVMIGRNG
jgi:hypothetical protein